MRQWVRTKSPHPGPAVEPREQQLCTAVQSLPSVLCARGAQKVPSSDSNHPEWDRRGARGTAGRGCARAPAGEERRARGDPGWQQRRQQGQEGATQLNGCDKWAARAHHTERKGEGEGRGRPGQRELPTRSRAGPAPALRRSDTGHSQSSAAVAGRNITATGRPLSTRDPIQPSHRDPCPTLWAADRAWTPWGRAAPGWDRSLRGWTAHAKALLKVSVLLVPALPLLRQWIHSLSRHVLPAPTLHWCPCRPAQAVPQLPEAPALSPLFSFRIVVTAPRIPLIYPQPYKPGFHLQSLGNQDISTAVSFWQRPVLPLFFPQHIFHS